MVRHRPQLRPLRQRGRRLRRGAGLHRGAHVAGPRLDRARVLLQLGRYEDAAAELRGALVDDPDDPVPHGLLALVLCDLRRPDEALEAAQEAMRLAPDLPLSLLALANALLSSGRLEDAAGAAWDLIAASPLDTRG